MNCRYTQRHFCSLVNSYVIRANYHMRIFIEKVGVPFIYIGGGDNFNLKSILCFVESFSSTNYCRFCRCDSTELKCRCYEHLNKPLKNKDKRKLGLEHITKLSRNSNF